MKKPFFAIIFLLVVLTSGLFFYKPFKNKFFVSQKTPLKPVIVRLAWLPQAQFTGMYVAKDKGFYAENGLDVSLISYSEGFDDIRVSKLEKEKAYFVMPAAIELIIERSKGKDLKAVAAIYQTSPHAFVSLKEKNIDRPDELKGKVLGSKGGNTEAIVKYKAFLNIYGVSPKDVAIKNLDFGPTELDDLIAGRADIVDLYRTDQPYLFEKKNVPYNLLLPERYGLGQYGDTLATTDEIIKSDPDMVRRFVKSTLDGWRYTIDHREEALRIIAHYEAEQYKDPAYERRILDQSIPLIVPTGSRPLGIMDYGSWKRTYDNVKNADLLQSDFDVSEAYTNEFIR